MPIERDDLIAWIFGAERTRRFVQDSPVLPDVWFAYGQEPTGRVDLLLTPHAESTAAELASALLERLPNSQQEARLAYNESYVVVKLSFPELIQMVLPLSPWWQRVLSPLGNGRAAAWIRGHRKELSGQLLPEAELSRTVRKGGELAWFIGLIGRVELARNRGEDSVTERKLIDAAAKLLMRAKPAAAEPLLWLVNRNREAQTAVWRSRMAVKADAATRLFDISCAGLRWAIVDDGVDASHPAFRRRGPDGAPMALPPPGGPGEIPTRVVATYDFTRLRDAVATPPAQGQLPAGLSPADLQQLQQRLRRGRYVDWDVIGPLILVPQDQTYVSPANEHGTHVAGILAADWRTSDPDMPARHDIRGVCPDLELYDLRVFDQNGRGDEFAILAALQFVRHLNAHSDLQVIHGANLSLALYHDVENYACGRTPVCDECERLVATGVCVVTAAGNEGRADYATPAGISGGYRTVSITDPGNAEQVITVGATHRFQPHVYGVSYFSSRGPTGDGRRKPDLVAPGERIQSAVPGDDVKAKDGTSQATPHVSGAAALLMARHEELLAQPQRVKQILCGTATDLGREPYFQGAGMVDALRALQSV